MSAYTHHIKENDRRPNLMAQVTDHTGKLTDFTEADAVTFTMRHKVGNTLKINKGTARFDTDSNGIKSLLVYDWQAGDTDTKGTFYGEFEVVWDTASGITQTFPDKDYIKIIVGNDLA